MNLDLQNAIDRFNAEHPILDFLPAENRRRQACASHGGEYKGPCPLCGGDDRFYAQPNSSTGPRAACRQCCPKGGHALYWHMRLAGLELKGNTARFLKAQGYLGTTSGPPRKITPPPAPPAPVCEKPAFTEDDLLNALFGGDIGEVAYCEGIASADFFEVLLALPSFAREDLSERASILEYCGEHSRAEAERLALEYRKTPSGIEC